MLNPEEIYPNLTASLERADRSFADWASSLIDWRTSLAQQPTFDDATLLIGLGPPRTGSKWLSNYFSQHSEILMSPIRILHYFDQTDNYNLRAEDRLRTAEARLVKRTGAVPDPPPPAISLLRDRVRMNHEPDAYLEYFRKRWSAEKVFADITPSYFALERDVFTRMRHVHPKVRFLLVMRNPIDRYWSGMRLSQMHDSQLDPIAKLDRNLEGKTPPWRRNYVTALTDLDAVVPPQDVKVCFFEEMFDMTAIADLCAFLGVATEPAEVGSPMNQSEGGGLDTERRARLYAKFQPIYRFVHDRYSGRLPPSWLEDMDRFGN